MKKINLFNKTISPLSDGKGCPVERGGVWACWRNAPRITPSPFGATPSWKEGERKVPSYRRRPVSRGFNRGGGIPLFSGMTAVIFALFIATPSFAEPTELDKKTVASKAYVDTKQDIIETGLVTFHELEEDIDYTVPALVSYGTGTNNADGVLGNKIGILGINQAVGGLYSYDFLDDLWDDEESGFLDNFVPTVRAVAETLSNLYRIKQDKLPAALTNTMASMGGQTIDLGASKGSVNLRYITAGGAQPLTQKSGADNVILYINGTKTLAQYQTSNFGGAGGTATTNQNYIKGALVSLELLKDVYSALHTEIQNATPTGTPGNVAMYDPTTGALGNGVATYSGATAQNPYNATNDAAKIATAAAVETKQDIIPTGLAQFDDFGTTATVPALVVTNAAGTALNGNTIGFLDLNTYDELDSSLDELPDTLVPSIGLLADELRSKQDKLDVKSSNAHAQAVTRGNSAGSTSSAYITAGGSVGLTTRSGAPAVINYVNGTVSTDEQFTTFANGTFGDATSVILTSHKNFIKNALVSLELLKDVYAELNSKITNNALPTGTTGTVVTYNGVNAETGVQEFGERAVYDPANAYNAQNDATKLATMASVKYECAGYEAGHENDPDYCWLWALPN